jgi:hypothetical protein
MMAICRRLNSLHTCACLWACERVIFVSLNEWQPLADCSRLRPAELRAQRSHASLLQQSRGDSFIHLRLDDGERLGRIR